MVVYIYKGGDAMVAARKGSRVIKLNGSLEVTLSP